MARNRLSPQTSYANQIEVCYLVWIGTTRLTLFQLIVRKASYKEHILRSKDEASVVVLTDRRVCSRIHRGRTGKAGDMTVQIARDSDLINAAVRSVRLRRP